MYTTDMYEGMIAETVTVQAEDGTAINAYFARPLGPGPHPGMVLAHHMPGWDEWYRGVCTEVCASWLCDDFAGSVITVSVMRRRRMLLPMHVRKGVFLTIRRLGILRLRCAI